MPDQPKADIAALLDTVYNLLTTENKETAARRLFDHISPHTPETLAAAISEARPHSYMTEHEILEPLFDRLSTRLRDNAFNRLSTAAVAANLDFLRSALDIKDIVGARTLEIGAGVAAPLSLSAVLYLNGAVECWAIDMAAIQSDADACKSLLRLLVEAISKPQKWHFSSLPREEFDKRVQAFDLTALVEGRLSEAIAGVPISFHVTRIAEITREKFDFVCSVSVLEHLAPFPDACECFWALTRVGGIMSHTVDFSDHGFHAGTVPHRWGYLTPDGGDGYGINRIRLSEMLQAIAGAGFRTLATHALLRESPPKDVLCSLAPEYRHLSTEDIETITATIISQRSS